MRLPWMNRSDRQLWRSARTIADLGLLMASWLEGDIASQPGYMPNCGVDEETEHLVPILAAANRTGYLTTCSQPGLEGPGFDGSTWRQRAAVDGHVSDPLLLRALADAAAETGLYFATQDRIPDRTEAAITVTTVNGEPYTTFGQPLSYSDLRTIWPVIRPEAFHAVATSVHVTIAAPEFGKAGEYLWDVLDQALIETCEARVADGRACIVCGCTEFAPCPGGCAWVAGTPVPLCTACRVTAPADLTIHVL
ncbi:DUF6919 domain-containing protein [Streptomyces sp. CA-111067]|uniref:DUF6919 domain-containing protein n=1 Tax=Streptomyces sp. CA-111067 TaxID=3240046 RepID=UPI003D977BF4